MLLEIIIFALILGFAWNRYVIEELKMQVFDLNQELACKSSEPCTTFGIGECEN